MGAAVAAIVARKQRDIVDAYRGAGATTAARSRSPGELGIEHQRIFHGLIDRAVLRESGDGRFYLDEPTWDAHLRARRRLAVVVVVIAVALLMVLVASGALVTRTASGG